MFQAILLDAYKFNNIIFLGTKYFYQLRVSLTSDYIVQCLLASVAVGEMFTVCGTWSWFKFKTLLKCMLNLIIASRFSSFLFYFSYLGLCAVVE